MKTKSPFMVFQEFVSPLLSETIIDLLDVTVPDTDIEGNPIRMRMQHDSAQELIFERLLPIIPQIEQHYNVKYKGTEQPMVFEWCDEGCDSTHPMCENSHYVKGKWLRTKHRDLTGVLFLSEFRDTVPFDDDYEVYGGKLEFPQHGFGFNPQRGTLVIYPSDPHFINVTTSVEAGELFQVRLNISTEEVLIYNPAEFPGEFSSWLQEFA